jgi:hypothetical protein
MICSNYETPCYIPLPFLPLSWVHTFSSSPSQVCVFTDLNVVIQYCQNSLHLSCFITYVLITKTRPPLWSSGQSSWLQIQRSGFDSRVYHIIWEVVGLERSPLSLVSTTEELLGRKSSGSGLEIRDYCRRGSAALTTRHASIRKSCH